MRKRLLKRSKFHLSSNRILKSWSPQNILRYNKKERERDTVKKEKRQECYFNTTRLMRNTER